MEEKIRCTAYIDESGDLGVCRGTQWFVLSAVIVDKTSEKELRTRFSNIRNRLNVHDVHLRKITDFYKRGYIVKEINDCDFTYINIIADTSKFDKEKTLSSTVVYNFMCRMLLERVSWFLRDTNRIADIVLSARGTSRDGELIEYIKEKLIPYKSNKIVKNVFNNVCAKTAGSWDMLQLADVCATTMFLTYEKNGLGFRTPCYTKVLQKHLYSHNGHYDSYGIKYFTPNMKPTKNELKCNWICQ